MRTTDWNYDFSSLPRWKNREMFFDVYDEFVEIPQNDVLCCIYSITEVRMGDYRGFLAILKGKDAPSLLLNVADGYDFCDNFSASADGNLVFLQPSIYDECRGLKRPILIIDLTENRLSYVLTDNLNPLYKIKQKREYVFTIEADDSQKNEKRLKALHGKKIRTDKLKWHSIDRLRSLPEMIFGL